MGFVHFLKDVKLALMLTTVKYRSRFPDSAGAYCIDIEFHILFLQASDTIFSRQAQATAFPRSALDS